ncbi:MAG: lysoplasmalogenase [Deltaproteobacteria bacterium]|nr:lysoplasmalogenase [Deltaproteobacteria bacterium]
MTHTVIIASATVLLGVVLYAEKGEIRRLLVSSKSALSALFVLAALGAPHSLPVYDRPLVAGLCLCLVGDICLAFPQKRMFLAGLLSFLAGHVFYVIAFSRVAGLGGWTWLGGTATCGFSGWIYLWLRPHLGGMKGPVVLYVIVISAMLISAFSVLGHGILAVPVRWMVISGAICFYFSDIFVARDRFVRKEFLNRMVGLPMYYAGQFVLAFSIGMVNWTGP